MDKASHRLFAPRDAGFANACDSFVRLDNDEQKVANFANDVSLDGSDFHGATCLV